MVLSRRWSGFLLAVGAWTWLLWPTFMRNIAKDPRSFTDGRPQPFLLVHLVLAVVSLAVGTGVGWLGWRGLLAHRRPRPSRTGPRELGDGTHRRPFSGRGRMAMRAAGESGPEGGRAGGAD